MRKNLMIVSFAFIFLLSVSIVSAGWLSDLFSGKATGNAVITGMAAGCDDGEGGTSCEACGSKQDSCVTFGCTWTPDLDTGGGSCTDPEAIFRPGDSLLVRERAGFIPVAGTDTKLAVQSVDAAIGIASIVVKDEVTGRLETFTVAQGGSVRLATGEQLQVRKIESGGLFRRGADVEINIVPAGEGVGASVGGVTGVGIATGGACTGGPTWIDIYGTTSIVNQPINSVCPIGCNPIAYELRRDYWIYNDAACSNEISQSSDHQLLQSYGANVPNFGEEAGNMNTCFQRFGINYGTIEQMYDGVLCG